MTRTVAIRSAAVFFGSLVFSRAALAGSFSVPWYTIDGGGGTSTGIVYSVSGTIGQPDAGTLSGSTFTIKGGFWPGTSTPTAPRCSPADIAYDDGAPLPPIGPAGGVNNGVTEGDYNLFFATFFDAGAACDIANDDGTPLPPFGTLATNNGVTEGDYNLFFAIFFDGCSF